MKQPTRPWLVLLIVSAAAFMAALDLFIVNIAFPDIARDFDGASLDQLSWVLNAYTIVFAALLVPFGRWADRLGRRRGFLAGLAVFTVASALCAVAPTLEALVAARVVQALGAAVLVPTSLALLLPEFPPERRGAAVGVWAAVGGVAAALGPPLGGLLVEAGWRTVFLVNLPVGAIALVAATRVLREARDPAVGPRPDTLGALALATAVGALVVALVRAEAWGWGSPEVLGLLAGAVLAGALVAVRIARHPAPFVEPEMLRVPRFRAANGAAVLFYAAFAGLLLGAVLFLTGMWGMSVLTAGLALAPGPAMAALFAGPAGRWADRFGQRAVAIPGLLLFAGAGVWWLARMGTESDYAGGFLPAWLAGGIGVGLVIPTLAGAATSALPPARFATGAAVVTMSRQIGAALGVAVLVAALGTDSTAPPLGAFEDAWLLMIAATLAAAVVAIGIGPHERLPGGRAIVEVAG
jgi:EmrB/QacA subfamily drug resistance transporter